MRESRGKVSAFARCSVCRVAVTLLVGACGSPEGAPPGAGSGGAPGAGGAGAQASGGALSSGGQGSAAGGASSGAGGSPSGGASGGLSGIGGSEATGGMTGSGGSPGDTCGGEPLLEAPGPELSCGPRGHIFEAVGRPDNRVNYVIVGDGYDESQIGERFIEHVENMLYHEAAGLYSAIGEPYRRYRKFINVCGLKLASADACIDNPDENRDCDTLFDGRCEPPCSPSGTRLGVVNRNKVNAALAAELPDDVDADWVAVSLNADANGWWNSGGPVMVWNGGFQDRLSAASVALHEGGHTFHALADEYGGTSTTCGEYQEINSTADPEGEKWSHWIGYEDVRENSGPLPPHLVGRSTHGTFEQGVFEGSRYCDRGQYRPSKDSEMNQLPQPFNMPSMEKMILDIYSIVDPIDAHTPNDAPLAMPTGLQVKVVDPEVLKIEWSVDGEVISGATGECFVVPELAPGKHEVRVRVFDETPWVRKGRERLEQTVTWEVTVP